MESAPIQRVVYPHKIHMLVAAIENPKKRNLLRGCLSKSYVAQDDINAARHNCSKNDAQRVGAIFKGPSGLMSEGKNSLKKESADLFSVVSISPLDWEKEVCYTAGYIAASVSDAIKAIRYIERLSSVDTLDPAESLPVLLNLAMRFGASNFLSYKLAYIRSAHEATPQTLKIITEIEDEIRHKESPGLHFSALENISPKISIFLVAQKRVSTLIGRVDGDFRKAITLSNFIPTPISKGDASRFLLRATESSLIDTVYSILTIFNLGEDFGDIREILESRLDKRFLDELHGLIETLSKANRPNIITSHYRSRAGDESGAHDLYRLSAAFLEHRDLAVYRNRLDRVFGVRLLSAIFDGKIPEVSEPIIGKQLVLIPNGSVVSEVFDIYVDSFYRTYLFLRFMRNKSNLIDLTKSDIKFIFENTIELEVLLGEDELSSLYLMSPEDCRGLITVLALALYRKKSIDPDVDYQFRQDFIRYVNDDFNGSILGFIEYLLSDSPQIASYIVMSLDEVTLEKMYSLIRNASQASEVRREILMMVGKKLNRIEYIIEADAISTRSAVSKLQKYFDSSRMYVDSVAMKRWLDGNPSVSTDQFRSQFPNIEAREKEGAIYLQIIHQSEFLINQIAKDAFEQFCLNTEFGIQSYLGRRIRHNTLDGVTTETVDAVLRKAEYASVVSGPSGRRNVEAWRASYKAIIDKLRRESLQFKPGGSLFRSSLDLEDSTTKENIRMLSKSLEASGSGELLNDLIIAFCWKQITPQLENAARFIKTSVLKDANASIEKHFSEGGYFESQMKAELHQAVNEVLRKVADWFQVPQTGFISASVRDLCKIILIDLNRDDFVDFSGDAVDTKYTGISVHRLYDCLVVLLQNACKHGKGDARATVSAMATRASSDSILDGVEIEIASSVEDSQYDESKARLLKAIDSVEAGTDMVTEGYSGIKKIKFITRSSEGMDTASCGFDDLKKKLMPRFSLHMEIATEEASLEVSA